MLTPRDLFQFLFGSRTAIEKLGASRHSLWIGALLVLSASIARNHDGVWILGEPDVLLHGIGVSTLNALALFTLSYAVASAKRAARPPFASGALTFLGLFWLTAPMGWLYAIPYEHFLRPDLSVSANERSLTLVSIWRVLLISRVLSVLWSARFWVTLSLVLLFSDIVLLAALNLSPVPVIDFMGGLQHDDPDDAVAARNALAYVGAMVFLLPVGIFALCGVVRFRGGWTLDRTPSRVSRGFHVALVVVGLACALLLATFQPNQMRRFRAENLLRTSPGEGLLYMSQFGRDQFPPIWDPPPRRSRGEAQPSLRDVEAQLGDPAIADWVRSMYKQKSVFQRDPYKILDRLIIEEGENASAK